MLCFGMFDDFLGVSRIIFDDFGNVFWDLFNDFLGVSSLLLLMVDSKKRGRVKR